MNHRVVKMNKDEEELFAELSKLEKPYKVYYQRILPKATPPQRGYLFGCVYPAVGEYIGEKDVQVVHEMMLEKFSKEYAPLPYNPEVWKYRIKRSSEFDVIDITMYIEWICAWVFTEFGGSIPLPNEVWTNE